MEGSLAAKQDLFYFVTYRVLDIIYFDKATFYLISGATCFMVPGNFFLQIYINSQHHPIIFHIKTIF